MRILIDGHNAIHALGLSGETHEEIRKKLLRLVGEVAPEATVYFDARNAPPDIVSSKREFGVRVVYCRKVEADERILREVRDAEDAKTLVVVTNDRKVAGIARQHGAKAKRVREFFGPPPAEDRGGERRPPGGARLRPQDFGLPESVDLDDPDVD